MPPRSAASSSRILPRQTVHNLYAAVPFARFTDRTPARMEDLHVLLERERTAGYASSDSYYVEGVSSLAAAIFDERGSVVAALNIAGPSFLFDNKADRRAKLVDAVQTAAAEVSERLGFQAGWTQPTSNVA